MTFLVIEDLKEIEQLAVSAMTSVHGGSLYATETVLVFPNGQDIAAPYFPVRETEGYLPEWLTVEERPIIAA